MATIKVLTTYQRLVFMIKYSSLGMDGSKTLQDLSKAFKGIRELKDGIMSDTDSAMKVKKEIFENGIKKFEQKDGDQPVDLDRKTKGRTSLEIEYNKELEKFFMDEIELSLDEETISEIRKVITNIKPDNIKESDFNPAMGGPNKSDVLLLLMEFVYDLSKALGDDKTTESKKK